MNEWRLLCTHSIASRFQKKRETLSSVVLAQRFLHPLVSRFTEWKSVTVETTCRFQTSSSNGAVESAFGLATPYGIIYMPCVSVGLNTVSI